ncbi:hypothetical protein DBIPINDM_003524 [Mesorhizobium sp. AR02]|uniref:hypothetical protein n=1 Tax=Mesorhizobium sp. AR02 TaxID=2865837 RepID=UPI002160C237|nr:hypothetical protein [Mesorhizobium sp. AR02]UVK50387.1 hypothetical protein DBIPINDM_003524 [Mesorhizobium sp. AR02]
MIIAIIACVVLIGMLCMLAFTLATYALPLLLGLEVARFAFHSGAGFLGAVLVGIVVGMLVFGLAFSLLGIVRSPILQIAVALVYTAPAVIAGYALVYGVTREYVPPDIWRQLFCIVGGLFVGFSALLRLMAAAGPDPARRPVQP